MQILNMVGDVLLHVKARAQVNVQVVRGVVMAHAWGDAKVTTN